MPLKSCSKTDKARGRLCHALACLILLLPSQVYADLIWYWDDPFTDAEKTRMQSWLSATHAALEAYAGPLPFDVHVHLKRSRRGGEPVPWAHTWRAGKQALYFTVDTKYPQQAFLEDWTAPHEFSHLLLPYLGDRGAWFAEGFASYLQHSIMVELGVLDADEARARRNKAMQRAADRLDREQTPLPDNVSSLRRQYAYGTYYWGGAIYFERVDDRLASAGSDLRTVIRSYLQCCRGQPAASLNDMAQTLDTVSNTSVFTEELVAMQTTPGCVSRPGNPS